MNQITTMKGAALPQQPPENARADVRIQHNLITRKADFEKVLPAHITFERFQRTVMTACFQNPDLLHSDLQSLMLSCMKAATDGLLPDGREAALVIFNTKVKTPEGERWIKKAQYMPMWVGLLKKIRQSQEVESVRAHIVYEADYKKGKFEYILGDEERIIHEPYVGSEPRGPIIAAYAIAKLKGGDIIREVMTIEDIEKVRRTSKSGNKDGEPIGIWRDWYEEMARKTVFRRLAKWLPQSAELLDRVFKNDDTLEAIESVPETVYMDKNPNAIEASDQSLAQIGNTPDIQVDLVAEINQQREKEASQVRAAVTPEEKAEKAIRNAINLEENESGLKTLFDKDFYSEFALLKKSKPEVFQNLVDEIESRRQKILIDAGNLPSMMGG